jgi:hypothetical protein
MSMCTAEHDNVLFSRMLNVSLTRCPGRRREHSQKTTAVYLFDAVPLDYRQHPAPRPASCRARRDGWQLRRHGPGAAILSGMPDEPEVPPRGENRPTAGRVIRGSATLQGQGTIVAGGTVRDAVQELRDASREELSRLLDLYNRDRAKLAGAETMATEAEATGLSGLAKLIRAGAKFGIMTIIAAIISGPVNYEESNLMHWTPPPITTVQQMSPA